MPNLFIDVNEAVYQKFQSILDSKEIVSSTQATHNFMNGVLLKVATVLLTKNEDRLSFYTKIGKESDGNKRIKDLYISKESDDELVFKAMAASDFISQPWTFFKGCFVAEVNKQYKLYCCGKRGRR